MLSISSRDLQFPGSAALYGDLFLTKSDLRGDDYMNGGFADHLTAGHHFDHRIARKTFLCDICAIDDSAHSLFLHPEVGISRQLCIVAGNAVAGGRNRHHRTGRDIGMFRL